MTKFSKSLRRVIWLVAQCWDEQKYLAGADKAAKDLSDDSEPLEVSKITSVVKNNFFRRYLHLVVAVDSIPEERIASWGSICPCHETLRNCHEMSEHLCGKMMESHFGEGVHSCILSGCRASDLAAAHIKVFFFAVDVCLYGGG